MGHLFNVTRLVACAALLAACVARPAEPTGRLEAPPAAEPAPSGAEPAATATAPTTATATAPTTATDPAPADPGIEDVTERFREATSDRFAPLPTSFRAGSVSPAPLPAAGFERTDHGWQWRVPSGSSVMTPAIHQGTLIFSGGFRSKEMFAVDALTGAVRWGAALHDDGPSSPACEAGLCAFNTESCTLFVVDARTGDLVWSLWLGDPLASAPAVADGRVFSSYPVPLVGAAQQQQRVVGAGPPEPVAAGKPRPAGMTHALAAFDLRTGAILWQRWIDAEVMAAPVVEGGKVHVTTFAGTYLRLDQASGEIELAQSLRATSPPTVLAGGEVVFTRRADQGGAVGETVARAGRPDFDPSVRKARVAPYLDPVAQAKTDYFQAGQGNDAANGFAGGAPAAANAGVAQQNVGVASVYTMQAFQGSRLVPTAGGNVSTMGDEVVGTDPETGAERWSVKLDGDVTRAGGALGSSPVVAGGMVFVGTVAGEVLAIDPVAGEVAGRWSVGAPVRAQLLVHEGWIYAATTDGRVVAIDTGRRAWTGWAQWGGNAQRTGKG